VRSPQHFALYVSDLRLQI